MPWCGLVPVKRGRGRQKKIAGGREQNRTRMGAESGRSGGAEGAVASAVCRVPADGVRNLLHPPRGDGHTMVCRYRIPSLNDPSNQPLLHPAPSPPGIFDEAATWYHQRTELSPPPRTHPPRTSTLTLHHQRNGQKSWRSHYVPYTRKRLWVPLGRRCQPSTAAAAAPFPARIHDSTTPGRPCGTSAPWPTRM